MGMYVSGELQEILEYMTSPEEAHIMLIELAYLNFDFDEKQFREIQRMAWEEVKSRQNG